MSVFKAKWESECAVKVISRNLGTQEVESVVCLFVEPLEGNPPIMTVTKRENKLKRSRVSVHHGGLTN